MFDDELDAVADQQLITIGDGEVFDGVLSIRDTEAIGAAAADEGVIAFAAIEAIVMGTAFQDIASGFAFEQVIAFSADQTIAFSVADQGVVAEMPQKGVVSVFAAERVGQNVALEGIGLAVSGDVAIAGGEETWIDDRTIGDAIAITGWITVDEFENNGID